MTQKANLLIHSASQLLTLASPDGPQRGRDLGHLGLIENGAVAVRDAQILMTGPTDSVRAWVEAEQEIDATGRVVMPAEQKRQPRVQTSPSIMKVTLPFE